MIRVGLLGRGMAGTVFHAPLIAATPELQLAATAGSAQAAEVIADAAIDLIVVATPHDSHFALADAALRAGKHVVVDKPLTTSAADADRLIELAQRQGRLLTVFHNRRWDGDFLTVRELVNSGRLGDIKLFEANWDRFRPQVPHGWREVPAEGAGTLWNLGPHMVDQMLLLFGEPDACQADIVAQRTAAQVDDYFSLTFRYGKMRAVVGASNLVAAPRPRFAIHGSKGSFVKSGLDPQEDKLKAGSHPAEPGFGDEPPNTYGTLIDGYGNSEILRTETGHYVGFYSAVAAALLRGACTPVDPRDARVGIKLIAAAHGIYSANVSAV